ncbi:MAG: helix-hairpin-helix domain-containing protein [Pseudomonadota bacterium]|nr:helix-hairpin-helix domain-containing protein [Pseudomonadota bacterium]
MKSAFRAFFILALLVLLGSPVYSAGLIDINTASVEELTNLPGIGPALAEKIVERRAVKPFSSAEDLMDVKGIGPAKYEAIKGMVSVGGAGGSTMRGAAAKEKGEDMLKKTQKKGMGKASEMTEELAPKKK